MPEASSSLLTQDALDDNSNGQDIAAYSIKDEPGESGVEYAANYESDESELDVTTPQPWYCSECKITFKSAKLLAVHLSNNHQSDHEMLPPDNPVNQPNEKFVHAIRTSQFTCTYCSENFNSKLEIQQVTNFDCFLIK